MFLLLMRSLLMDGKRSGPRAPTPNGGEANVGLTNISRERWSVQRLAWGMAPDGNQVLRPPARLRGLTSWQVSKLATLGARLTAPRMPLGARTDFAVLAALDEYGELSQAELGRRLGLDRNDVNGVLNRLQQRHQVDRRADPADRRRNVVSVTDAGRQQLEDLQRHADAVQEQLLAHLDPADRDQLHALLAKLLASHDPQPA
jgi:DNA-binding MarR family transcriptional regulator